MAFEDIDQELADWFEESTNSMQYEVEGYADDVILALITLLEKKKRDILLILKESNLEAVGGDVSFENDDQYLNFLKKNYDALSKEIEAISKIDAEIQSLNKTLKKSIAHQIEYISNYTYGIAALSFYFAGLELKIPGMTAKQIRAILDLDYDPENEGLGKYDRIDKLTNSMSERIRNLILAYILAGTGGSYEELVAKISAMFPGDGRNGWILNRIDQLERTELQAAMMAAVLLRYWQSRGELMGARYSAVWDHRLCAICASNAHAFGDTVFLWDRLPVIIPIHPRCRCLWIPTVIPYSQMMTQYGLEEAQNPSKLMFKKTDDLRKWLAKTKGMYSQWDSIKINSELTIKKFPMNYFKSNIFKTNTDGSYVFDDAWSRYIRKNYTSIFDAKKIF